MNVIGIIAEYNPFHNGHALHISDTRRAFGNAGEETVIVSIMSGNYAQRGDFAVFNKHVRAAAAIADDTEDGADVVIELPTPFALSSAERFSEGAIGMLEKLGVKYLSFGSETGNTEELSEIADILLSEEFLPVLKSEFTKEMSFAAARQKAVEKLAGKKVPALTTPNNILGIEYIKALKKQKSAIKPMTVKRIGAAHDEQVPQDDIASASAVRNMMRQRGDAWKKFVPQRAVKIYDAEIKKGRGPVYIENCERAILAKLRSIDDFEIFDESKSGAGNRLKKAVLNSATFEELINSAKTKKYARSRITRMAMRAYTGFEKEYVPKELSYVKVLAANERGRKFLKTAKRNVSVITKPAHIKRLGQDAIELAEREALATDLYVLGYPDIREAVCGSEWLNGIYMV